MTPLVDVLTRTTEWFKQRGIPSPRMEAELILAHLLGVDRVKVYLNFDRPMSDDELARLREMVRRRGNREPLAWVFGEKEFYGRLFTVGPGVLVPRPDTETIVEAAIEAVEGDPVYVADVGSGTGCIGLTVALEKPGVRVFAIDISDAALACTRANVERHGLKERVAVLRGDQLAAVPASRTIDWVLANPPYIPTSDLTGLQPEVRDHEPRLALDGGPDGLGPYRTLIPAAAKRARVGVMVEVGIHQADAVAAMMEAEGLTTSRKADLGGVDRVVIGRR